MNKELNRCITDNCPGYLTSANVYEGMKPGSAKPKVSYSRIDTAKVAPLVEDAVKHERAAAKAVKKAAAADVMEKKKAAWQAKLREWRVANGQPADPIPKAERPRRRRHDKPPAAEASTGGDGERSHDAATRSGSLPAVNGAAVEAASNKAPSNGAAMNSNDDSAAVSTPEPPPLPDDVTLVPLTRFRSDADDENSVHKRTATQGAKILKAATVKAAPAEAVSPGAKAPAPKEGQENSLSCNIRAPESNPGAPVALSPVEAKPAEVPAAAADPAGMAGKRKKKVKAQRMHLSEFVGAEPSPSEVRDL